MPKFVPRPRKQKDRQKAAESSRQVQDTNATEITPVSTTKDEERKRLREELRAHQPKISAKKQKRLDKYIVRKLYPGLRGSLLISSSSFHRRINLRKMKI